MLGYLLDTNHVSAALRPVSLLRDRLEQARQNGLRVGTCVPVLCELEEAWRPIERRESYRRALRRLLSRVRIWPIDPDVAPLYGEIYQDLRARGRVLSQVDMMLAALAQHMDLTILTADRDFETVPSTRIENWVQ